ncbi:MAG: hypothetical protein IPJ30_16170 [Acidobacteria bacterium]|nr:hypothetical protein [Acidobacteriota bacterium]
MFEFAQFAGRKRLAPVEFEFVGVAIFEKLLKCLAKSVSRFRGRSR